MVSLSQQRRRVLRLHALVGHFCLLSLFVGEVRGFCALSTASKRQFKGCVQTQKGRGPGLAESTVFEDNTPWESNRICLCHK